MCFKVIHFESPPFLRHNHPPVHPPPPRPPPPPPPQLCYSFCQTASDCRRSCRPPRAPWAFSCNSLRFLSLCLSPPRRWISQEVIDIFEGVRDDQALRMAANLGFKGPLQRQVMYAPGASNWMRRRGSGDLRGHKHTLTVAAAELPARRLFEVSLLETAPPSSRFCFFFPSLCLSHNGTCQRVRAGAINSNNI